MRKSHIKNWGGEIHFRKPTRRMMVRFYCRYELASESESNIAILNLYNRSAHLTLNVSHMIR